MAFVGIGGDGFFVCVGWRRLSCASAGDGFRVRRMATAFVCVGGRWLSCASDGDSFRVRRKATAFVGAGWRRLLRASAGDGFRGRRLATALLRGVARGNFCDGGVKFRRGKSCAGGYVGSEVGCHVGWLHVAAGWSLTETGR